MAPTYPDFHRCHKPCDVPSYAKDLNCCPPYNGETPTPFTFPTHLPMRTRVSAHLVDEKYIGKYAWAVRMMKELPPDDPRNFTQQANVHCAYCQRSYYMGKSEKLLNIHCGWFFLPWHRWYVYFHERILAKLLGDDTFALPFWNWDFEQGMTIPTMYLDRSLSLFNEKRNSSHDSSSVVDLGSETSKTKTEQVEYNYKLLYKQIVSLAKTTRAFHGGKVTEESSTCKCAAGTLEVAPHDTVHVWAGSPITDQSPCPSETCYGEDMGVFYSAARDPIFFAHHANIDRVWTLWKSLPGRENYTDPDLLDTQFFFYDENKRLVSVRAGDAYDMEKLRYKYQYRPAPWLGKPGHDNIPPPFALPCTAIQRWSSQRNVHFRKPVQINVGRQPKSASRSVEELLLIEGIRVQRNIAVKFDVFVNLDDSLVDTSYVDTVPREYAGTFLELPRGATDEEECGCGTSSLCFGISEVLSDLNVGEEEESIEVTLIPKVNVDEDIRISAVTVDYLFAFV